MFQKQKLLFKKWKLSTRDCWVFFLLSYKIGKRRISQHIYKTSKRKDEIRDFLVDMYFAYEYDSALSLNDIATLLLTNEGNAGKKIKELNSKIKFYAQEYMS